MNNGDISQGVKGPGDELVSSLLQKLKVPSVTLDMALNSILFLLNVWMA